MQRSCFCERGAHVLFVLYGVRAHMPEEVLFLRSFALQVLFDGIPDDFRSSRIEFIGREPYVSLHGRAEHERGAMKYESGQSEYRTLFKSVRFVFLIEALKRNEVVGPLDIRLPKKVSPCPNDEGRSRGGAYEHGGQRDTERVERKNDIGKKGTGK